MSLSTSLTAFSALVFAAGTVATAQSLTPAHRDAAYGKHAMAFEPNRGQVAAPTKFLAHGSNYSVLLTPAQATLLMHHEQGTAEQRRKALATGKAMPASREVIRMSLAGGKVDAPLAGERGLPGYVNYISGADRGKDRTGIPTYAATRVRGAYAGIDLLYYGT